MKGGEELEGTPRPGAPLLTSSAWARSRGSSACLHSAAFFWVTASRAAHLQLEIQAAHEIMDRVSEGRLRNTGKISKDTHAQLSHALGAQGCLLDPVTKTPVLV